MVQMSKQKKQGDVVSRSEFDRIVQRLDALEGRVESIEEDMFKWIANDLFDWFKYYAPS